MRRYQIRILGRSYVIATRMDEKDVNALEARINKDLAEFRSRTPDGDIFDIFMNCIFNLYEQTDALEKELAAERSCRDLVRKKLKNLEESIKEELEKLTNSSRGFRM